MIVSIKQNLLNHLVFTSTEANYMLADFHGSKLTSLLNSSKLPNVDKPTIREAIERYKDLKTNLLSIRNNCTSIDEMVGLINDYKNYIDLDVIFDSKSDFLYRQNGQLKLSNSILEEFIPYFITPNIIKGLSNIRNISIGSKSSFSGLFFDSIPLLFGTGGVLIKSKDQDFAISKSYDLIIKDSIDALLEHKRQLNIAFFASEIKTNLDKTMFQEACQTARELKMAVLGSKYILICEYLDMTPISTKLTPIDEVIILRKSKRLSSNIRQHFSQYSGRVNYRSEFKDFLENNPLSIDGFNRLINHLNEIFPEMEKIDDTNVLQKGYF